MRGGVGRRGPGTEAVPNPAQLRPSASEQSRAPGAEAPPRVALPPEAEEPEAAPGHKGRPRG